MNLQELKDSLLCSFEGYYKSLLGSEDKTHKQLTVLYFDFTQVLLKALEELDEYTYGLSMKIIELDDLDRYEERDEVYIGFDRCINLRLYVEDFLCESEAALKEKNSRTLSAFLRITDTVIRKITLL